MTNSTECVLWPNKAGRCTTVLSLQKAVGGISFIACLFVLFVIVILKKYKVFVQKLILALVVSAAFHSIAYMIGNVYTESGPACRFQGVMMHFFDWATLLWVFVIAVNLLLVVLGKNNTTYLYWFHGFVWITALFWTIIPFFGDNYGPAGIWCWIKRDATKLRFGVWYIPLIILLLCMVVVYLYIIYNVIQATKPQSGVFSEAEQQRNRSYRQELKPLIGYPLIYIILYTPAFMYRIDDAANPDEAPNFSLALINAVFVPSIGAVNALYFAVFNATIHELSWSRIKQSCVALFSSTPTQVIHKNYTVHDQSSTNGNSVELSSGYNSANSTSSPTLSAYAT